MAKSKYETHVEPRFEEIERWRTVEGLTEKQIAKMLGVAYSTFREYKNKYPAFSALLKRTKEVLLSELEKSLFKTAMGFTGEDDRYYPPNTTAIIFALANLSPKKWRRADKELKEEKQPVVKDDRTNKVIKDLDNWDI